MKKNQMQRRYLGEGDTPPKDAPPAKAFDQKAVDEIIGKKVSELQRKFDAQRAQDLERMKTLETDASKAAELQQQLDELNNRYKSKEELAADAYKKEKASWDENFKKAATERDGWRKRWEEQTRDAALMAAASAKDSEVFSVEQVMWFLQPRSKVVQKVIDGKPVDEYETRIAYQETKDGKPVTLDLTPAEALARMKGDEQRFGNFFRTNKTGGTGGSGPSGPGQSKKLVDLPQNEFTKLFLEGKLPKS